MPDLDQHPSPALLRDGDPPPFEVFNPDGNAPILIVSDHASRAFPAHLNQLGLDDAHLDLHIAYDIGADMITRLLAKRINAVAVLCGYSRLLIDCNRQPGHPQSIPAISDAISIPGNHDLSEADQRARVSEVFTPYHEAITEQIAHLWRIGPAPVIFSIHSFTPSMNGEDRFWDIGVLWNRDPRVALPLIEHLRAWPRLHVGDNEPYSGRDLAYTIDLHGTAGGLANCAVEIRQDHCATYAEAAHWADILGTALSDILQDSALHVPKNY